MKVSFDYKKFRRLRQEKRLTQFKLAELSGTTDRYIRAMEKGKSVNPSAIILCRAALVLGVPAEEFMLFVPEDGDDNG